MAKMVLRGGEATFGAGSDEPRGTGSGRRREQRAPRRAVLPRWPAGPCERPARRGGAGGATRRGSGLHGRQGGAASARHGGVGPAVQGGAGPGTTVQGGGADSGSAGRPPGKGGAGSRRGTAGGSAGRGLGDARRGLGKKPTAPLLYKINFRELWVSPSEVNRAGPGPQP
jgi:hypothetical protein